MTTIRPALVFLFACLPISLAQGEPGSLIDRHPFTLIVYDSFTYANDVDIAADDDGNFTIVWSNDFEEAAPPYGIWARRFAANGVPLGLQFEVAPGPQLGPEIVMAADGRFVVAWYRLAQPNRGLRFRRYNAAGVALSNSVPVDTGGLSPTWDPKLAMDAGGNFLVLWHNEPVNDVTSIHAQLFNANGTARGTPFLIKQATAPTAVDQPAVAMSAGGEFVVVWEKTVDSGSAAVRGRRFDADGMQVGPEFTVAPQNSQTTRLRGVDVAMDGDGNFVVGYERRGSASLGVFARRFDAAANALGAEFQVSNRGIAASGYGDDLDMLDLDMNAAGDFAFAGHGRVETRTRLFNSDGSAVMPERSFSDTYLSPPWGLALAMNADGSYIVAWSRPEYLSIFAQRVAGPQDAQSACSIYVATDVGTNLDDVMTGTPGDDVIQAGNGVDWVDGGGGNDIICGGGGGGELYGNVGSDQLFGGKGDDFLHGGDGQDTCNGGEHQNGDTAQACETVINVP